MNRVNITYHLYRSNPLSARIISVPEHFLIRDLLASFCLSMGIPVACGEMYELIPIEPEETGSRKGVEEAARLDMDVPVREWLDKSRKSQGDILKNPIHGKAYIYADEKSRSVGELTIFFQVEDSNIDSSHFMGEETSERATTKETEETFAKIPVVLDACGWHLPAGVFRIGQINEIWQSFDQNESIQMNGITYIASRLNYDEKKTHGLICSHFVPELASMLHTELAAPWSVILETYKVSELDELCKSHMVYYRTKKKAEIIYFLLKNFFEIIDMKTVFEKMDYSEYMVFRNVMINGVPDLKTKPDLQDAFPTLYFYGMVAWSKKTELLFLEELVTYYEEWYDTEREMRYRKGKFFTYVLNGCGYYYGIFSKEMGWRLIDKIYPDYVTREEYDEFWDTNGKYRKDLKVNICNLYSETSGWAYNVELWNEMKNPMLYYRALVEDESPRYIPKRDEFTDMCLYQLNYLGEEVSNILKKSYYYYDSLYPFDEIGKICLNAIRMGLSASEVAENVANKAVRYYYRDSLITRLVPVIKEIQPYVPQVLLYGYTEKQMASCKVPDTARKRYEVIVKEAVKEETRRKKEEQERKKQAKKQTGKKRRRY